MIHKMGFDCQCEVCGCACMVDEVNDEGDCVDCTSRRIVSTTKTRTP